MKIYQRIRSISRSLTPVIILLVCCSMCQKGVREKKPAHPDRKQSASDHPVSQDSLPLINVVDGESRDLGVLKEGIKAQVVFTLVNIGNARATDISVHDLSKGGCTAVSTISELAAGDTAQLVFVFETLGYGGKEQLRQVKVRYNNPEHSPFTLSVSAAVLPTEVYQVPIGELFYNFFVLIDVRELSDFRRGHIVGAIHCSGDELFDWVAQLPKGFMIYLYSDDGTMSDQYALELRKMGYSRALSIVGGLHEWKAQYGDRYIITGNK